MRPESSPDLGRFVMPPAPPPPPAPEVPPAPEAPPAPLPAAEVPPGPEVPPCATSPGAAVGLRLTVSSWRPSAIRRPSPHVLRGPCSRSCARCSHARASRTVRPVIAKARLSMIRAGARHVPRSSARPLDRKRFVHQGAVDIEGSARAFCGGHDRELNVARGVSRHVQSRNRCRRYRLG
jgi:hypothetical protein